MGQVIKGKIQLTNPQGAVVAQSATPGTAQTGTNINISGAIVAGDKITAGANGFASTAGDLVLSAGNVTLTNGNISTSVGTIQGPLIKAGLTIYVGNIPMVDRGSSFPVSSLQDGQRFFHSTRRQDYEYDSSTFNGPPTQWYLLGVGDKDDFTRSNSTTDIGSTLGNSAWWQPWAAAQGVWGINSNQAYIASGETNNDSVLVPLGTNNPTVQCQIIGNISGSTNARVPGLIFCALDKDNYLYTDMVNGLIRLNKRDAATNTVLTSTATTTADSTTYTLTVVKKGRFVTVYVDGVAKISNYDLTLANSKFNNYTWGGLRVGINGTPTIAARWSNFVARQAA